MKCTVKNGAAEPDDYTFSDGTTTWTKDATANKAKTLGAWSGGVFEASLTVDNTYCTKEETKTITCTVKYGTQSISKTAKLKCFHTRFVVTSTTNKALKGTGEVIFTNKVISIKEPAKHNFESSAFGENYYIETGTWDAATNVSIGRRVNI